MRAPELSASLDDVTVKLNPLIERAERALARLYTVSAEIPLNATKRLRFGKYGKEWRLLLVGIEDRVEQPLVAGSRSLRIVALANLPYLGVELNAELEAQAMNAARVVAAADAYLTELEART